MVRTGVGRNRATCPLPRNPVVTSFPLAQTEYSLNYSHAEAQSRLPLSPVGTPPGGHFGGKGSRDRARWGKGVLEGVVIANREPRGAMSRGAMRQRLLVDSLHAEWSR